MRVARRTLKNFLQRNDEQNRGECRARHKGNTGRYRKLKLRALLAVVMDKQVQVRESMTYLKTIFIELKNVLPREKFGHCDLLGPRSCDPVKAADVVTLMVDLEI